MRWSYNSESGLMRCLFGGTAGHVWQWHQRCCSLLSSRWVSKHEPRALCRPSKSDFSTGSLLVLILGLGCSLAALTTSIQSRIVVTITQTRLPFYMYRKPSAGNPCWEYRQIMLQFMQSLPTMDCHINHIVRTCLFSVQGCMNEHTRGIRKLIVSHAVRPISHWHS